MAELKIGVNMRFDGEEGITAEHIGFDTETGEQRSLTSRQVKRQNKRKGDKALIKLLKAEAKKMKRGAGGAAIKDRASARAVFAAELERGEKVLKDPAVEQYKRERAAQIAAFKHPWQRPPLTPRLSDIIGKGR